MDSVHGLKQSIKNQRILVSPGSDSSWEGYDEVRSKHRNDPAVMNKLRENLKSKATVKHAPNEIDKKIEGVTTRPNLPKGMKYVIKKIPSHPLRFGTAYRANFLDDFESSIGEEGIKLFRQSIFGHYLDMPNCNFQGQIIKCLLLLEVDQKNKEELHIRHVQGNILRFTINNFAIITGLRCTGNMNDFKYSDDQASRLLSLYFPGAKNGVNKARFVERFLVRGWKTNEDAVQMAILYFIHTFVFSQLGDAPISVDDFKMVEDGSYEQYPWGKLAYSKLIKGMRQEFSNAKQMYRLGGMPYALNV
ncbi:uncharacterized protein LOC129896258 [Solanum dulcamara]|uniref:uncharacterized protein LOC129896258 n=1 Tax=Solanum dulcamara TaxID=45834 RepID=UPI00248676C9|nr:uncharacterized protein LOC129896258 [Solanum dulcamara]